MIKFTIATVCYNAGYLLQRTIASVEEQDYAAVEHLIVDGNSHDETLAHIHHYQERNSRSAVQHEIVCRSEPDEGLYDAMNKALSLATGHYTRRLPSRKLPRRLTNAIAATSPPSSMAIQTSSTARAISFVTAA